MTERIGLVRGKTRRRLALLLAAGFLAASTVSTTAMAANADVPSEDEVTTFLVENMERFDVPQELRDSLLEKALSGATLDADIPGSVPVSEDTVTNDYGTFPVTRFADGSFDSQGVSEVITDSDGDVTARGVQFCTGRGDENGGVGGDCQAYHWTFWHNMYFRFDYSWTNNVESELLAMPEGKRGLDSGSSCTTDTFGITQRYGTNSSNAKGDWNVICTDQFGTSQTKHLGIRVPTDGWTYTTANY